MVRVTRVWEQEAALKNWAIHHRQGRAHRYVDATPETCLKCHRTTERVRLAFKLSSIPQAFALAKEALR